MYVCAHTIIMTLTMISGETDKLLMQKYILQAFASMGKDDMIVY